MENIKFGTDGWRAVVGKDFNKENVETVTKAIGKYILDNFGIDKPVIIGYDLNYSLISDLMFNTAKESFRLLYLLTEQRI